MAPISRRTLIAAALVGVQGALAGCGIGFGDEKYDEVSDSTGAAPGDDVTSVDTGPTTPPPAAWDVGAMLTLLADGVTRFDLLTTLPAGTPTGGRFSIAPDGAELPPGVSLSPEGILSASSGAVIGPVNGVVFAYSLT